MSGFLYLVVCKVSVPCISGLCFQWLTNVHVWTPHRFIPVSLTHIHAASIHLLVAMNNAAVSVYVWTLNYSLYKSWYQEVESSCEELSCGQHTELRRAVRLLCRTAEEGTQWNLQRWEGAALCG